MNTPAVTNLIGARVRDPKGGEGTIMAIGTILVSEQANNRRRDWPEFVALLMLDDRQLQTVSLEGWTVVAG